MLCAPIVALQVWQNCSAGVRIELVKNELGGHRWIRNADFDTSVYMLQYFAKATRPPQQGETKY